MLLFMLLLAPALPMAEAQGANPRPADLEGPVAATAFAMAGNGAVAIGGEDPGSRFSGGEPGGLGGLPDAPTWRWWDATGKVLYSGGADWALAQDDCTDRLGDDCSSDVRALAMTPDGRHLLVASAISASPTDPNRGLIVLVHRDTGVKQRFTLDATPTHLAVSDAGDKVLVLASVQALGSTTSSRAYFLDLGTSGLSSNTQTQLTGAPRALAFAPDGLQALVATDQLMRIAPGAPAQLVTGTDGQAQALAITGAASHWAVSGHASGQVALLREESQQPVLLRTPGGAVGTVAIEPGGIWYVAGDAAGSVHLFRRTPDLSPPAAHVSSIKVGDTALSRATWSEDGRLLAVASGTRVHMLQRDGDRFASLWTDDVGASIAGLSMTPDGGTVAAAFGNEVRVYEARVDLQSNAGAITVQPAHNGTLAMQYTNTGNRPVEATLGVRAPSGWNASVTPAAFSLAVGAKTTVQVHVRAPAAGHPENATLWLDHRFPDGRTGSTRIDATVPEVRSLMLEGTGAQGAPITAGGSVRFMAVARNEGNVVGIVRPEATVDQQGWRVTISPREATIAPGGQAEWTIDVEAPADAGEGVLATIVVEASGATGNATYQAAVGARFGVQLDGPPSVPVRPDNTTSFQLRLTNLGNILDSYRLVLPDAQVPEAWQIHFEGGLRQIDLREVPAQGWVDVTVEVYSPHGLSHNGVLNLVFTATSLGQEARSDDARVALRSTGVEPPEENEGPAAGVLVLPALVAAALLSRRRHGCA